MPAAQAILFVNLTRALSDGEPDWGNPPVPFDEIRFHWGDLTPFVTEVDSEMEAALAGLSEVTP